MAEELKPKVGVGVMIMKDGKVLMQLRKGAHGEGQWAFPGGHLEHLESFQACARREVSEEVGIELTNFRFLLLYNMKAYAPKHYVHVTLLADWKSGEPQLLEPDKGEPWQWIDLNEVPSPIFDSAKVSIDCYKGGDWPCFIDAE